MAIKNRRPTRRIKVGPVSIGGGGPVLVQSMTNTDTHDHEATLEQIRALAAAGCELVRVAVPDQQALPALKKIVAASPLPVIADIQFDYRLALGALEAGVVKLRINPGTSGGTAGKGWPRGEAHGAAIGSASNAGSSPEVAGGKKGDIRAMLAALGSNSGSCWTGF